MYGIATYSNLLIARTTYPSTASKPCQSHTHTHTRLTIKWLEFGSEGIMQNGVTKENKLISLFKWIIKHWITSHLRDVHDIEHTTTSWYLLVEFLTWCGWELHSLWLYASRSSDAYSCLHRYTSWNHFACERVCGRSLFFSLINNFNNKF